MIPEQPNTPRRPPVVALLSFACLIAAIVLFLFSAWSAGIGFLVFHWLLGALAMITKRRQRKAQQPQNGDPDQRNAT